MYKLNFDPESVYIRANTEGIGPFSFDFTPAIPDNMSISGVEVRSTCRGKDSTATLITTGSVESTLTSISLKLDHPGNEYLGAHILAFTITYNAGAVCQYNFGYIKVE